MTTSRRIERASKRLNLGSGPRVECPPCQGTGRVYDVDGPHSGWEIEQRVHMILTARSIREGTPPPPSFDLPEPVESLVICSMCRGTGEVSESKVARIEQQAEVSRIVI